MTSIPSFHEMENLSAYLDGQLSPEARARLESRLASDLRLQAALEELRATQELLRRTPQQRAPRNFLLTPEMVGIHPPVPRLVPVFRYASAVSVLLLVLTFVANYVAPIVTSRAAPIYGMGGGAPEAVPTLVGALMAESSAAESNSIPQPAGELVPQPTPGLDTAVQKQPTIIPPQEPGSEEATVEQPEVSRLIQETERPGPLISPTWQVLLVGLTVFSAGMALIVHFQNERAFRRKISRTPGKK